MKKKLALLCTLALALALAVCGACLLTGCSDDPYADSLMLHVAFEEGKGKEVSDSSRHLGKEEIRYVFNDAQFKNSEDPQWRESGAVGGSILFDGYSNYIEYDYTDIRVYGSSFTVSAYVAPRMFEWDDPNAKENGTEHLTGIVSQYYKRDSQGFLLGYWRYGELSFQVGIGDRWLSIWSGSARLNKYEWNYVVAQFDGAAGEMRLYLNGELVAADTFFEGAEIARAYDEPLYIGRNSYPNSNQTASENMLSGMIDEVKLYDEVIGEEYISEYYAEHGSPEIAYEDITLQNILTDDIYKTQYHGGPYQMWMNEPHAPIYYKGVYHLFFQYNIAGPYWKQICWGHLVSDDMVNWKPMPEVITPTDGSVCPDGVWSGGATYDSNGVPVLFFTAGNDSFAKDGLISNQNLGSAYPADPDDPYLKDWIVCEDLAVAQQSGWGRTGEFRDAHLWKEGDTWCMLVCSGSTTSSGGTALLFTTTTLTVDYENDDINMNWQYRGPVYTLDNQPSWMGTSWELPLLLPLTNEAGTAEKYVFIISPAPASTADNKIYYFIGDFDLSTGKFTPDADFAGNPRMIDYGSNVFTGPSAFIDPVSGEAYLFSVMQDYRGAGDVAASGWACCVGLARRIWLNDEGTDLKVEPVDALQEYETELVSGEDLSVAEANELLGGVDEDMLCLRVTFRNTSATSFGIRVKCGRDGLDQTSYTYNVAQANITGATLNKGDTAANASTSGALALEDGKLSAEIYIDRSLVEAFFNETKALSIRSYAAFESTGIELFAEGDVVIESLQVCSVRSIY